MSDSKSSSVSFGLPILSMLLGYFVYGGLNGALGMGLLSILAGITIMLGLIPVLGNIIQYVLLKSWLFPEVLAFVGLKATWLTGVLLWCNVVSGIILSLIIIVVVIGTIVTR